MSASPMRMQTLALARQGHAAQALELIGPVVKLVPAAMRALHSVRRWHERIALGLREGSA